MNVSSSDSLIKREEGDRYVKYSTSHETVFYFKRLTSYSGFYGSQEIYNAEDRFKALHTAYEKQTYDADTLKALSLMSCSSLKG
jgi:hypothetical protein